jgi:hypothetical protein
VGALVAAITLCLSSAPALHAQLPTPTPSIEPLVQESGQITLSLDGLGIIGSTGTIQVEKPVGATVRRAFLAAASTGLSERILVNGDVKIDGTDVNWSVTRRSSTIEAYNHWSEVTSVVKPKIDAAPAGRVDFTITEVDSSGIEGEVLAVIFDDPNQLTTNTVFLLFGAQNALGDRFILNLAEPLDKTLPNVAVQMSLGISYSAQGNSQASQVDVNGSRLTSSAGGADDGETANGALLTVGGLDDSFDNPAPLENPTNARTDDELYDLLPFVQQGATTITVDTLNPSNDDNIFFAAFFFKDIGAAIGDNQPPTANAGIDQTVPQTGALTSVTLNGSGSSDPDGDALTYTWREGATVIATGVNPTVQLGPGTHNITLTVTDTSNASSTDTVVITVVGASVGSEGAITGNGTLSTTQGIPSAQQPANVRPLAKNKRTVTTTFWGSNTRGRTRGGVIYTDRINGINLRSTEITSVQINGNVGTISGIARINGVGGYSFVLRAIDNFPTYVVAGDGFSLEISGGDEPFNISSTFAPGGVRVVSTGNSVVLPPVDF